MKKRFKNFFTIVNYDYNNIFSLTLKQFRKWFFYAILKAFLFPMLAYIPVAIYYYIFINSTLSSSALVLLLATLISSVLICSIIDYNFRKTYNMRKGIRK